MSLMRVAVAEGLGTAFLVAAVVGSGIMGEQLSGGNAAIALLANSLASAAALVALIFAFTRPANARTLCRWWSERTSPRRIGSRPRRRLPIRR